MISVLLIAIVLLVQLSEPLLMSGSAQFTESEVTVTEGAPKSITVELLAKVSVATDIKVHAVTPSQYYELDNVLCELKLTDIRIDMDAAEESDFQIAEFNLSFTPNIYRQSFSFQVVDDEISETEEWLILYLNMTGNRCALIVNIQDNDRVKIGFLNTSLVLREGGESQTICVSVLQGQLQYQSEINLSLLKSTKRLANIEETKGFILSDVKTQYCFTIFIVDDSISDNNLNARISLIRRKMAGSGDFKLILSPYTVHINILDDDVVTFYDHPNNISSVINGKAFFPCRYEGTYIIPSWRITTSDGVTRVYTHNTLPRYHFYNLTGLLLTKITPTQNLTIYSCFFRLFIAGSYEKSSASGSLIIMTPITFDVTGTNGSENSKELFLREGDRTENLIKIVRQAATDLTFRVSLLFEPIQGNFSESDRTSFTQESYIFYPNTTERNVPIPIDILTEDNIPEKRKIFCLSVAHPIQIIDGSNLLNPAMAGSTINVSIYDNDYYIGFTNSSIIINEGEIGEACISFLHHPHEIDPMTYILLQLKLYNELTSDSGVLLRTPINPMLSKKNSTYCLNIDTSLLSSSSQSNNDVMEFTLELSLINSTAHNIHFERKYSVVIVTRQTSYFNELTIAFASLLLMFSLSCVLIIIILCIYIYKMQSIKTIHGESTSVMKSQRPRYKHNIMTDL